MADTLITGGLVVDGTAPGVVRDVGIRDGCFVPPDEVGIGAAVDATGLVVAPGFVDIHTHYDAQLSWDPSASPSPLHGVTTGDRRQLRLHAGAGGRGQRRLPHADDGPGRGDAPRRPRGRTHLGLVVVRRLDHPARRRRRDQRRVPGRSLGGAASGARRGLSRARQCRAGRGHGLALAEACAAGALGFSTSTAPTHNDADGEPVRRAAPRPRSWWRGRCAPARHHVGVHPRRRLNGFTDEEKDLLARMSVAGQRPVNWNVLGVSAWNPDGHTSWRHPTTPREQGGGSSPSPSPLDAHPALVPVRVRARRTAGVARCCRCRCPTGCRRSPIPSSAAGWRRGVRGGGAVGLANWKRLELIETFARENKPFEGRTVGDVVAERGGDPFDVLLDLVLADELRTGPVPPGWRDPRRLGVAGRSVARSLDRRRRVGRRRPPRHDVRCHLLDGLARHGVREFGVVSLEEAVHQLTDAGPSLRPGGAGSPTGTRPTPCCSTRRRSATATSASARTCRVGRGGSAARPTASTGCW